MASAESEEAGPDRVDLYDQSSLRRALQEAAVEAAKDAGYKQSFFVDNVRIGLGLITVALTAAAHLLPGKYPAHRRELLIIVAAHYVVAAASAAFMWLKGKDAFAHFCAGGPAGATPVSMQLKYPRYAQTFQLRVVSQDRSFESEKGDVASFFHSDGFLARDKFAEWVAGVLDQFKKQTRAQRLKAQ